MAEKGGGGVSGGKGGGGAAGGREGWMVEGREGWCGEGKWGEGGREDGRGEEEVWLDRTGKHDRRVG